MKRWFASKTIWSNLVTLGIGVAGYLQGHELIAEHPEIVAGFTVVIAALNLALRFVTTKPIQ